MIVIYKLFTEVGLVFLPKLFSVTYPHGLLGPWGTILCMVSKYGWLDMIAYLIHYKIHWRAQRLKG